jgi:predicted dehydrogenase
MIDHLLVCGLGSIGRRHLRHFRSLGVERIDAYRTGKATIPEDGNWLPDRAFSSLKEALAQRPKAVVISNPTSMHVPVALESVRAGAHVLIEKPLSSSMEGVEELILVTKDSGLVAAVAFNMRFHPAVEAARKLVMSGGMGRPIMMRAHFGSYLPDWHPWEDYKSSYSARRELGGGAALTHNHEIDYTLWILGPVAGAHGMAGMINPLETDVDEASVIIMRHNSGAVSSITLSLAQKPGSRGFNIEFTKGIFEADLISGKWTTRDAAGHLEEYGAPSGFSIDQTYREQALAFMEAIEGNACILANLDDAARAVEIALNIRREDA